MRKKGTAADCGLSMNCEGRRNVATGASGREVATLFAVGDRVTGKLVLGLGVGTCGGGCGTPGNRPRDVSKVVKCTIHRKPVCTKRGSSKDFKCRSGCDPRT